ncbi:MAG: hypothetical protein V1921_02755 [Candidatus Altiarchaeota archaeon]
MVEEKQKKSRAPETPSIHEKVPIHDFPHDIVPGSHPFASEARKVFHGGTKFGAFFQPLFKKLNALPKEEQTESFKTFEMIYDFLRDKRFPDMEFTRDDVLFLLTTDLGNLIRRPILHTCFAQQIEDEVKPKTGDAKEIMHTVMPLIRGQAWSRFIEKPDVLEEIKTKYPNEEIYVDFWKNIKKVSQDALSKSRVDFADIIWGMDEIAWRFRKKHTPLMSISDEDEYSRKMGEPVPCDIEHAFGQPGDINVIKYHATSSIKDSLKPTKPLIKSATLMVVEDNPLHQLFFFNAEEKIKNLTMYRPQKGNEAQDKSQREQEDIGCYRSAERALDLIEQSGKAPDLLLADVELAGKKTGIDLIREIHKRWPNTVICMIYSSDYNRYKNQIKELENAGLISGSWYKGDFNPDKMVDLVNKEFEKRT